MKNVIIWRTILHNLSLGKEVKWDIMGEITTHRATVASYRILVQKPEMERPLWRPKPKMKKCHLEKFEEAGCGRELHLRGAG